MARFCREWCASGSVMANLFIKRRLGLGDGPLLPLAAVGLAHALQLQKHVHSAGQFAPGTGEAQAKELRVFARLQLRGLAHGHDDGALAQIPGEIVHRAVRQAAGADEYAVAAEVEDAPDAAKAGAAPGDGNAARLQRRCAARALFLRRKGDDDVRHSPSPPPFARGRVNK